MVGKIFGTAVGAAFRYGTPALMLYQGVRGVQDKVRNGTNPAFAVATEGLGTAANLMLPWPAQVAMMGIPITRAATMAVIGGVRSHNSYVRMAKTPFSHRFEHNQTSWRAQQLGMQSIGAAWAHSLQGSEAGAFAARYGRR